MAKITIDEKEYDTNDLSEEAIAQANSLRFVQSELARLQGLIAVHKTAEASYSQALKKAVEA